MLRTMLDGRQITKLKYIPYRLQTENHVFHVAHCFTRVHVRTYKYCLVGRDTEGSRCFFKKSKSLSSLSVWVVNSQSESSGFELHKRSCIRRPMFWPQGFILDVITHNCAHYWTNVYWTSRPSVSGKEQSKQHTCNGVWFSKFTLKIQTRNLHNPSICRV